jgi:inhibitor of cysteine peptidase
MKTNLSTTSILVMLTGILLLSACGSIPEPIQLGAEANGTQVELKVGQQVVISLESNPTTGFGWHVPFVDEGVLTQVGEVEFTQGEEAEGLVGAGGIETLTFEAVAKGTTTLTLTYDRSWESVDPEQTFTLTIVIK